ncbi:hypothetical protein LepocDRAFT_00003760 [Leptothrix ochracea L12]|uniref:Uncharacterized protein n=1 Tax=Leptothrix ochracea L12 TaxID=735332 RepID=I4Z601_9BURK|nr:hypothetical protein [Leptothrix ochracea]EIM31643.1 hypothetical protein LepocDRAFT_00003760 [Leptothrix ochracea L12]
MPLDALLQATSVGFGRAEAPAMVQLEVMRDLVNSQIDVFQIRGQDPALQGTNIGDYAGQHVRGLLRTHADRLRLEGQVWQRNMQDRDSVIRVTSWQTGVQWRMNDDRSADQSYAVRLSSWGNQSQAIERASNLSLQAMGWHATVQQMRIEQPRDTQLQADLIGSWRPYRLSAFVGVGQSRVEHGDISGQATLSGCTYRLQFDPTALIARPAPGCSSPMTVRVPLSLLPFDLQGETRYQARFIHMGGSWSLLMPMPSAWSMQLGYEHQRLDRGTLDRLIAQRGVRPVDRNHIGIAQIGYQMEPGWSLVVRAQVMTQSWVGEMPMSYNTLTAQLMDRLYGWLSTGIQADFEPIEGA